MAQTLRVRTPTSSLPILHLPLCRDPKLPRSVEHPRPSRTSSWLQTSDFIPVLSTSTINPSSQRFCTSSFFSHGQSRRDYRSTQFGTRPNCFPRVEIRPRQQQQQYLSTTRSQSRSLTVLAIESSADDSCAAIVTSRREIRSNVVIKQHLLNARYGGIQPIEAMRAHMANVVSGSPSPTSSFSVSVSLSLASPSPLQDRFHRE
jgi:hypothetical protein